MTDVVSELVTKATEARSNDVPLSHDFVCRLAKEVQTLTQDRGLVINHTAPLMAFVDDAASDDLGLVITVREANAIAAEIEQLRARP